MNKSPVISR